MQNMKFIYITQRIYITQFIYITQIIYITQLRHLGQYKLYIGTILNLLINSIAIAAIFMQY